MATYIVTGHPLNYNDLGVAAADADAVRNVIQANGVGQSVTLTLSGPDDALLVDAGVIDPG
jgi:hypothetical protein